MRRQLAVPLAALVLSGLIVAAGPGPAGAAVTGAASPAAQPPPGSAPPDAKAWMLVDADTGAVVQAFNDHAPMRPASVEKIVTGLLAVAALSPDASVPVGADAAAEEAAKINMKAGQVWTFQDTLHSLLMVSANDAAVALADRVSGSTTGFARLAQVVGQRMGTADNPLLNDPAGLDDSFAVGGGDLISAWDLALFTRAAMTYPAFSSVVRLPIYDFVGPDGVHHVLRNHNKLLLTDPTLVGVKPGYTRAAGDTYVAEAQRDGRSMLVVELGVAPATMYPGAEYLFGQGFATPEDAEPTVDRLPPVRVPDVAALAASLQKTGSVPLTPVPSAHARAASTTRVSAAASGSGGSGLLRVLLLVAAAAVVWVLSRRRWPRPAARTRPAAQTRPAARTRPAAGPRPVAPAHPSHRPTHPMVPVPDYAPGPPEAPEDFWRAAGAAWGAAVPGQLVDWAEWEIVGSPEAAAAQEARNRRAASIER
jgi:serine-type D-Ala-D-Ala carboxypeptidase (penicillin-binding protein 5/6)